MAGTLAPGHSPGVIEVAGSLTLDDRANTLIQVFDATSGEVLVLEAIPEAAMAVFLMLGSVMVYYRKRLK